MGSYFRDAVVGEVAHGNSTLAGGGDVNGIHTDAVPDQSLQIGAGIHDLAVQLDQDGHQNIGVLAAIYDILLRFAGLQD